MNVRSTRQIPELLGGGREGKMPVWSVLLRTSRRFAMCGGGVRFRRTWGLSAFAIGFISLLSFLPQLAWWWRKFYLMLPYVNVQVVIV